MKLRLGNSVITKKLKHTNDTFFLVERRLLKEETEVLDSYVVIVKNLKTFICKSKNAENRGQGMSSEWI